MKVTWFYTSSGKAAFYQDGSNIFTPKGKAAYSVSDGWWLSSPDGKQAYSVDTNCIFTPDGKPAFYYAT